jgi:hypothetical protein
MYYMISLCGIFPLYWVFTAAWHQPTPAYSSLHQKYTHIRQKKIIQEWGKKESWHTWHPWHSNILFDTSKNVSLICYIMPMLHFPTKLPCHSMECSCPPLPLPLQTKRKRGTKESWHDTNDNLDTPIWCWTQLKCTVRIFCDKPMLCIATKFPCQGCQRRPISLTALGIHKCEKKRKERKKGGGGRERDWTW